MNTQYKCTPQPRPHQKSWENWQADLQYTYNPSISLALPAHLCLGTQLPLNITKGWIKLQCQDRVTHLYPKVWSAYHPLILCQVILIHWQFILTEDELIQDPPKDILPTKV